MAKSVTPHLIVLDKQLTPKKQKVNQQQGQHNPNQEGPRGGVIPSDVLLINSLSYNHKDDLISLSVYPQDTVAMVAGGEDDSRGHQIDTLLSTETLCIDGNYISEIAVNKNQLHTRKVRRVRNIWASNAMV